LIATTFAGKRTVVEILKVNVKNAENALVIEKKGEAQVRKAEATVVDGLVLQDAAEIESYEIGATRT
jgi:hypothetical protein